MGPLVGEHSPVDELVPKILQHRTHDIQDREKAGGAITPPEPVDQPEFEGDLGVVSRKAEGLSAAAVGCQRGSERVVDNTEDCGQVDGRVSDSHRPICPHVAVRTYNSDPEGEKGHSWLCVANAVPIAAKVAHPLDGHIQQCRKLLRGRVCSK